MADSSETDDKATAQVYRLVKLDSGLSNNLFRKPVGDDVPANAVVSNAAEPEDEYQQFYAGGARDADLLEPPYNLRRLVALSQENNTLLPCIEAMVTNIEGTGYDFEKDDDNAEDSEDDANIEKLREFFDQPWPGETFVSMRKELRRDLEATGNAYLEVLRNAQDEIVFLRRVDAKMMRLVRLDEAVPVKKSLRRDGVEQVVTVMQRERRFCQLLNGVQLVYFKEFGASRDLNKNTGSWSPVGSRMPAKQRATEIIHLTCLPDARTPYGVPRWINQMPSVLGSRKAEEFNMEFFDNGGIPPVLITLQGGTLQTETRQALEKKMQGGAAKLNRVQILEVEPSGGSMEHPTQARVTVERFGGDRTTDSMFENYDDKCEKRVRRAFRLAPIFLGNADDYSFASAYVSYTVTEAQVFKPERDEFDQVISMRLLAEMGYPEYRLASKPLVIEDVNLKLEGIQVALTTNRVDLADAIYELNEATGLNLKVTEEEPKVPRGMEDTHAIDAKGNLIRLPQPEQPAGAAQGTPKGGMGGSTSVSEASSNATVAKAERLGILALAKDTLAALRERNFVELNKNLELVRSLDPVALEEFRKSCAELQFVNPAHDLDGLSELAGCTIAVMQRDCCPHH